MGNNHSHLKLIEKVEEAYINETMESPPTQPQSETKSTSPTQPLQTKSNPLTQPQSETISTPPTQPLQKESKSTPHSTTTGGGEKDPQEKKHKSSRFHSLVKNLWNKIEHEEGYLNEKQAKGFFEEAYEYFQKLLERHGTYFNPNIPKEQIVSEWISAFDLDKDKKLSFDEFVHALQILALATHPEVGKLTEGENPLIHETFVYEFNVPSMFKKYDHEDAKVREGIKEHIPLEINSLGLEIVVDGFNGSGVRTLVQHYAGPLTPSNYAQCHRDIYSNGHPIPIKVYLHPKREYFDGDYLPLSQEYPFRFHLVVLVFDLTSPVNDELKVAVNIRCAMIKRYLDQTYERVPHPPLLFLGNKMDDVENLPQVKIFYKELAEKYNAMFSCVSAKSGLFVTKSFRQAFLISIGRRYDRKEEDKKEFK